MSRQGSLYFFIIKLIVSGIGGILVFSFAFLGLEVAARGYHVLIEGGTFFRVSGLTSPWFLSYESPPPRVDAEGRSFFVHETEPTNRQKDPGTIRIMAVGGSTTVNWRSFQKVAFDYASKLEAELQAAEPGLAVEVLNAGGLGYSTAHSLVNISLRLVEYEPDVIILMHNVNDSSVNIFDGGATADYSNKYLKPYFINAQLQMALSVTGFLYQSRLLTRLGVPKLLMNEAGDLHPDNGIEYGLYLFKRNLSHIAAICRLHGIELVLLSQPNLPDKTKDISDATFSAYNQAIRAVAEDRGVAFVDMYTQMGHEASLFEDAFHYTPAGVERFVSILLPVVSRLVRSEAASPPEERTP